MCLQLTISFTLSEHQHMTNFLLGYSDFSKTLKLIKNNNRLEISSAALSKSRANY